MSDMTGKPPASEGMKKKTSRNAGAEAEIGRKLKQYYDSLVTEEVPDRFAELLGKLDRVEKKP